MDGNDQTAATGTAQPERSAQRGHWAALVEEQTGSGLSAAAFCRQRQVPVWQFYGWRQRIKRAARLRMCAGSPGEGLCVWRWRPGMAWGRAGSRCG
jgi:hypothetical protein